MYFYNRQRTAQPHSWHIGRHQKTPKSMHASGTSGPVASRDDGAVFLTAVKTNKGSVRQGFLLTLKTTKLNAFSVRSSKLTTPKNHRKKAESEYRAQQQRGSNARYHQLRSAFSVRGSEVSVFGEETVYVSGVSFFSVHLGMRT